MDLFEYAGRGGLGRYLRGMLHQLPPRQSIWRNTGGSDHLPQPFLAQGSRESVVRSAPHSGKGPAGGEPDR